MGDTENIPDVFVVTRVPPQEPVYSCQTAPVPSEPPLTVRVDEFPEHIDVGLAEIDVGAVEAELTVTVTETQLVVLHVPLALM